ncbi:MAG: hypothetical protein HZA89_14080 [Verrucomicrobia bacterium]|nr:hypothetical protein [Verrucomicrobiota bacterium]
MTATTVIEEIKHLPPGEQSRVLRFACDLARERQLSGSPAPLTPEELGELTRRMVETKDPAEAAGLQADIMRGFYGSAAHA